MPQAVVLLATQISAFAANAAAAAGASSATIEAVSTIAYSVATTAVTTGALYGLGAAFAPKVPDPQALQTPLKQPMPVRQSATGRVRVAGAYAFFGTGVGSASALSIDILALLDGRSQGFVSYYLNDDLMAQEGDYWWAPGAPGKYGAGGNNAPNLVQIDSRLGLDTETSYSEIAPALPLWDASHRGDGVTTMALYCKPARREDQAGDFPNGVPTSSAVIDAQLLYDPRDSGQTQGDESTYVYTDNAVLGLLAYLTDAAGGMGLNWARFFEPAVEFWETAADEADGKVATSGMHATLLDGAAKDDTKIFLADVTGLVSGSIISLPTEDVTASTFGDAGEVDIASGLKYAHQAGELAYWDATGQRGRYSCGATYGHDTPPGDVVKSYLSTFDGWIGQRGDGALVPRTNTLFAPTVVLSDRHIVGYQVQHYLPDEQATNQLVVSYTDPASAFNKAEAGYVQDDIDIAARGQVRPQELYLQWVPSGPQAISVGRAVLARATQPLRGTVNCNLAGLAVLGERFVRLQISELPALNDVVVEVTDKPTIDLSSMTVSFPWVAVGNLSPNSSQAICFVLDITRYFTAGTVDNLKAGVINALTLVAATYGAGLDLAVVAYGHSVTSIVKRAATAADLADIITWVQGLSQDANQSFDAPSSLTEAKAFFDDTDPSILTHRLIMLWGGVPDTTSDSSLWPSYLAAAKAVIDAMPGVLVYSIDVEGLFGTTYTAVLDNTPEDGLPLATTAPVIASTIEHAIFGSSTTPGAGYTLPPLAPPSGSPLQPLAAPTIASVTPDYPDSGGGVAGARLLVVVSDQGDVAWKVRWKLSTDTSWTEISVSDPTGSPPELLTGLVTASGTVDVEVAYVTASQVSPWSDTSTVTVTAALGSVSSTGKSASFTTTSDHNVYYLDTSSAAITVTLNASPGADETVEIWDATGHAAANAISFAGNGHNIAGAASVASFININFGHARLIWDGTQWLMQ